MRVVAGTHKGRRLSAPRGAAVRPTADHVREAVFNLLGPLEGEAVLDLFAGSGALAIEALSRGAAAATLVDSSPAAVSAVRANLERLGIDGQKAHVVRADARAFLRSAARRGKRWDLAFCDPPYRLAARLEASLGGSLAAVMAPEARVVCESSIRQPLRLDLPLVLERSYGDTLIAIHSVPGTVDDGA